MRTAIVVLTLSLSMFAAPAWATTGTCSSAPDGTPCVDTCVDSGHCGAGVCVADVVASDGTACSTGNFCTLGDTCHAGACVAGSSQRVCPSAPDSCHVSSCAPAIGCMMTLVCFDGGAPPDLMSSPDLAPTAPVVGNDLATSSPADLATSPPGVDAASPVVIIVGDMAQPPVVVADMGAPSDSGEPAGPSAPFGSPDMASATPVNGKGPYVHGSAVGCSVGGGGAADPLLAAILFFVLLAPLRRRRAA
jgi:MYXO-CTERM domain-containing protein